MPAQLIALIFLLTSLPFGVWPGCSVGKLHAHPGAENTGQEGR